MAEIERPQLMGRGHFSWLYGLSQLTVYRILPIIGR